jgi:hypothetical protein
MSAHLPPTAPGANLPGGDPAGPPVRAYGLPGRPSSGTASPTAYGSGSPSKFSKKRVDLAQDAVLVVELWKCTRMEFAFVPGQIWGLYDVVLQDASALRDGGEALDGFVTQ